MRRRFRFSPLDSLYWLFMFPVVLGIVLYACAWLTLTGRFR